MMFLLNQESNSNTQMSSDLNASMEKKTLLNIVSFEIIENFLSWALLRSWRSCIIARKTCAKTECIFWNQFNNKIDLLTEWPPPRHKNTDPTVKSVGVTLLLSQKISLEAHDRHNRHEEHQEYQRHDRHDRHKLLYGN